MNSSQRAGIHHETRRAEYAIEARQAPVGVFVPREHAPGAEATVDFGVVRVAMATSNDGTGIGAGRIRRRPSYFEVPVAVCVPTPEVFSAF